MRLRTQILFSIIGITFLAQVVFGLLAYRQIMESRGDQLTIFLQYLTREIAERLTLPGNDYIAAIYLEELRKKFSTPNSILIIQKDNKIIHITDNHTQKVEDITRHLVAAYADSDKHGLIDMQGTQFYWAVSQLPNKDYQLVMLEPAGNEEIAIASVLRLRLMISGLIILWIAVWIGLLLSARISRQLDEKNDQLKHLALHDNLTGLPNRTLLADRLGQVFSQAQRNQETFALFLMDLDRFKEVNDTLGHHFGDELLKMVSSRLQNSIRSNDSIARLGGDEFAVILPNTDLKGAEVCAENILQAMLPPFLINDVTTESKASIGIALYPEHGDNTDVVMQHADVAMYQAKKSQSGYAVYSPEQNIHSLRRLVLMNDLRDAVERHEITLHYQPLMSCPEQQVVSVEALARWQHPDLGNIPPDEFIPMAEQMGLIRSITLQIFSMALKDCQHCSQQDPQLGININLSTFCLQDLSFPDEIAVIIKEHNFDVRKIELEITESSLMHDFSRAGKILKKLNDIGVNLAIDDFGTGFSSLNYLKELPIDTLKIDKSFIFELCNQSNDRAIAKTIVELGHNLNCRVIAEGVENKDVIDELAKLNVDAMQGFYYSKPLPVDDFADWLTAYNQ